MDSSRASSRSRRSYPNLNLHNLNLAPLSSPKYPFDASTPPSPDSSGPRTSYIAQKSAPATPGILSLGHSRSSSQSGRRSRHNGFVYDGYFETGAMSGPVRDIGDVPKAISSDAIGMGVGNGMAHGVHFVEQPARKRHHERKRTAPLPLSVRAPMIRRHTSETNDEWFHRAGLAIAGETRDFKGQGWLIRRESSTSLVNQSDEYEQHASHDARHVALLSGEHLGEADMQYFTPKLSRAASAMHSRVGSRVPSARNSRRGSRVSSRVDLVMSGVKTPSGKSSLDLEENAFEEGMEPDFVQDEEDSGDDEETVARLARERGFGLGGWMDRLIGWTLFSVDEDGEESSDDEDLVGSRESVTQVTLDEMKLRKEVEARRRKLEREAIMAAAAVKYDEKAQKGEADSPNEEVGGWSDAAWLFSVASKVIL